jgi:hypothetical protein
LVAGAGPLAGLYSTTIPTERRVTLMYDKHTMAIIDGSGDTKINWDPDDADSVEAARDTFKKLIKKGHMAYSVHDKGKNLGKKNERITEFDPELENIIFIAPMTGG